jgi:hypothetical protein
VGGGTNHRTADNRQKRQETRNRDQHDGRPNKHVTSSHTIIASKAKEEHRAADLMRNMHREA